MFKLPKKGDRVRFIRTDAETEIQYRAWATVDEVADSDKGYLFLRLEPRTLTPANAPEHITYFAEQHITAHRSTYYSGLEHTGYWCLPEEERPGKVDYSPTRAH